MKRLNKKQGKRLAAALGVGLTLTGVGVSAAYYNSTQQPIAVRANAAEQAKLGTDATFEKGKDIPFQIVFQVPLDQNIKRIEFYDKLETCFEYQKARIFDENNNDVTDQGTLDFDKATNKVSWQAKDPKKWFGRKMIMRQWCS